MTNPDRIPEAVGCLFSLAVIGSCLGHSAHLRSVCILLPAGASSAQRRSGIMWPASRPPDGGDRLGGGVLPWRRREPGSRQALLLLYWGCRSCRVLRGCGGGG